MCLRSPGVQAVVLFRLAHWLRTQPFVVRLFVRPFVAWQGHRIRWKWGIHIGPEAQIGPGLYIWHYGGIFVAGDVVAGENFTLTHDVTLGYSKARNIRGFPTFGDNVYIAPGAKIAGKIKIGNNVKIGANAVVEKNIPDNAVVQIRPMLVVTFPARSEQEINCTENSAPFIQPPQPEYTEAPADTPVSMHHCTEFVEQF